jgi:uncharacterized protein (TIGR02284 family)
MDKEKSIAALNTLIETNNDRIAGYEKAIRETDDGDLKTLFSQFRRTSIKGKHELAEDIEQLGGTPAIGTNTGGQLLRVWMDFKATLPGNDRHSILLVCGYGEELVVETYNKALRDNPQDLTEIQQTRINAQRNLLIAESKQIKSIRNLLALRR